MSVSPTPDVGAFVDELGAIEKELSPYSGKIKRAEALRKLIRAAYVDSDAGKTFEAAGSRFVAILGCKALVSEVDIKRLVKLIGAKAFYGVASVTLKSLEAFPAAAAAVTQSATGTRPLALHEKGGAVV